MANKALVLMAGEVVRVEDTYGNVLCSVKLDENYELHIFKLDA